jgi:hypothetical protein
VCATTLLGAAATVGYLVDAAGFGVQPWAVLAIALVVTAAVAIAVPRESERGVTDLVAWIGILVFLGVMLLRLAWPSLLPPGRGPDLTHHLLLVDYIEQTRHLVHDRSLEGAMGEMAHYTPGAHVLAVMAGQWFGTDGLRAFYPLSVSSASLTAGFVFLIARRHGLSLPFAIAAPILLLLPSQYFFGAFTHDAFLAQTVSTLFAVAMWWALVAWDARPSLAGALLVAIFSLAVFLSWPIWLGPPLLVFLALVWRRDLPPPDRLRQMAIVLVPLAALVLLHAFARWGWVGIVRTSGAVMPPSFDNLGVLLPLLAVAGLIVTAADRRVRVTLVLTLVVVLQAVTLFIIAKAQGAHTPYMAFKMVYFAIYPLAVAGALAMSRVSGATILKDTIGWLLVSALMVVAARPALGAERAVPVIDADLYTAGKWVRAQGGSSCADYLVGDAETAYWLHLSVLGNPRSGPRMAEVDRYEPRAAMAPWITAEGRRYAIADLRLLPDEVRSRVEIKEQFGHAAVIARPGAAGCQ